MAVRESIISRITKLLNLAMDEGATESERQRAQELADALMFKNEIERSELTEEQKSRIASTTWDLDITSAGYEFYGNVLSLMEQVLTHCGCRGTVRRSANTKGYAVVGYPEDIAYAERMWFRVFREFVSNINPQWEESKSFDENVYAFVKAGFKWNDIWRRAYKAGQHPTDPYGYQAKEGGLCGRAYKRELKRRGEDWKRNTQSHSVYRSSYAISYGSTIGKRLEQLRKHSVETVEDSDKFALARISTEAEVEAEFYRLFPEFDPKVQEANHERRVRERQEWWDGLSAKEQAAYRRRQAAEQAKAERRARRGYYAQRAQRNTFDQAGWDRGQQVASKVDLSDNKAAGQPKRGIK